MFETHSIEEQEVWAGLNSLSLILRWVWVAVPLAWGVWQTTIKSLPLFE